MFYAKIKPGISAFEDSVTEISGYISQLLTAVSQAVPEALWPVTPVYFMATAGKFVTKGANPTPKRYFPMDSTAFECLQAN